MAAEKQQIPVGSARAAAHGTFGPTSWVNVFYFVVDAGAHTPGEVIAAVAQAVHDFYHDALGLAILGPSWHTNWTTVLYRDAADSIVRLRVADAQTGTGDTDMELGQCAYLINWSTGDPRRGGKPRTYVSGVTDSAMQDAANLTSGIQAAVNPTIVTWLEDLPTRDPALQLVEMSFRDANAWRDTPITYPILGGTLNPVIATQRRRVDRLRPS